VGSQDARVAIAQEEDLESKFRVPIIDNAIDKAISQVLQLLFSGL